MTDLYTILLSGGFATLCTSILGFTFRAWISTRIGESIKHEYATKFTTFKSELDHKYSEKLETFKIQLKSDSETELIKLKSTLETAATERHFRFSKTYEKTSEIIAETYKLLLKVQDDTYSIGNYIPHLKDNSHTPDPDLTQLRTQWANSGNEFLKYFHPNKIYLPKSTAENIYKFSLVLKKLVRTHSQALSAQSAQLSDRDIAEKYFEKVTDLQIDTIPKLMSDLTDDLQRILGFTVPVDDQKK